MKDSNIIGFFYAKDFDRLISLKDFKEAWIESKKRKTWLGELTKDEICNFLHNMELVRFHYDPATGEKIDWDFIKNYL